MLPLHLWLGGINVVFSPHHHLPFYSAQVKVFVDGLFHLNTDIPQFKEHLRDFLVQIKVRGQVAGLVQRLGTQTLHPDQLLLWEVYPLGQSQGAY